MNGEPSRYDKLESMLQGGNSEAHNVPLKYLRNITNNFSYEQLLGEGGFGTVYKGVLQNGEMIAVKRLKSSMPGVRDKQFENEANHLMRLKHPNVVLLVGWCSETEYTYVEYNGKYVLAERSETLLCLEYMHKGNLRGYLSDAFSGLGWDTRYKIIEGICYGLRYLHEECQINAPILHMDLKPANILLDNNMVPKIADFGLSRLFDEDKTSTCTRSRDGTLGYMSPEYIMKGVVSTQSDIFSLGVIIIEIVTGRRDYPDDTGTPDEFIEIVLNNWSQRKRIKNLVGLSLEVDYQQIRRCIQIGLDCVKTDRSKRPTISQIIKALHRPESADSSNMKGVDRPQSEKTDRNCWETGWIGRPAKKYTPGFSIYETFTLALHQWQKKTALRRIRVIFTTVIFVVLLKKRGTRTRSPPCRHHPSAGPSLAPSAPSYPIEDVLASMRLPDPDRHDYASSPSVPPSSTPFSGDGSSHGGGMQVVPNGAAAGGSQHGGRMQMVPYGAAARGPQHGGSFRASLKVLLHGSLDIWVHDARHLPNKHMFSKTVSNILGLRITSAVGSKMSGASMTSDPYITVQVSYATVARTYVIPNCENPVWSQDFMVPVGHEAAEVQFVVKDNAVFGAQIIGVVSIPAEKLLTGDRIQGVYPVLEPNGKPCAPGAVLHLSIQFIPVAQLTMYHHGVIAGPDSHGVPHTYFPLRRGMRVTLYQDAHVPDGCLPDIWLGNGLLYQHGQCWRDIYDAICQARKLIYIAGWSVFHTIHLVRDGTQAPSLGDLLKMKSQEGVRVLLLVWDDPTSRRILGYKMDGIMGTQDEETQRFFKHSSVQVLLCPRSAGKRHSWVKQQETGTFFTHHEKTVIVDADAGNYRRKIVAFIGGFDLCGGRYDTPWHPLFRTLQNEHKEDYYNPNFNTVDARGPREPWHDLHSKIDGPAAYDVLQNFQERWLKAAKRHGTKKLAKSYDDALLSIERTPEIININDAIYFSDNDPETWHVQVFRSIDSNSAKGFPKDPRAATMKNLVCGKNVLIDMSIHTAYVHAIRAAQHYIYIENQYFIGSSFNWDSNKDLGANNLIPIEIALKIANKIKAHERFSAYIVVPMWPEGNPTGAATQRILYWQNKTMQMMYETIYRALKEVGLDDMYEPQDYLNFFCLGNREVDDNTSTSNASNTANNPQEQARKNRRFMVYVHSKGMIVDDEYVIIGSANINQRSMEGIRDTEIAMGAYQPQYTWANKLSAPHGQIYGYRMSLWAEHIGSIEEDFNYPESLECMRRVRHLGEENWNQFVADEVTEMRGHLMKYPVSVDRKGKVKPLPGCTTFPDLGGNICGSFVAIQENLTI